MRTNVKMPMTYSVGNTTSENTLNRSPASDAWAMNPSAISVLDTAMMYSEARDVASLVVWARAPWSVKCSVVSAVRSRWGSTSSAMWWCSRGALALLPAPAARDAQSHVGQNRDRAVTYS